MSAWAVGSFLLLMVVIPLAVSEAGELAPWLAGRMVQRAASLLGTPKARERYAEEWAGNLDHVPGKLTKLAWACQLLFWSAPRMRVQIRSREQAASPAQPQESAEHVSFQARVSDFLTDLAGAQRDALRLTPSARLRFQSLGSAILIASSAAMISMWFAVSSALGINGILAVPVAALWGLVILRIDHWQVTAMPARGGRKFAMAALRLPLAISFGVLASAAINLRLFQQEISWQLSATGMRQRAFVVQQGSGAHQVSLLEKLQALSSLSSEFSIVATECILLLLLFTLIGFLPVSVKLLQRPGPYEVAVEAVKRAEGRENRRDQGQ